MINWIILFFIISAITGFMAFSQKAAAFAGISRILFLLSLALLLFSFIFLIATKDIRR
ncbi:MAG: DUF1328 domain-containing protein [Fibrobacter sp.]|nr:DUF1328 domain-containing protein [Fibrobacter sp.]